MQDMKLFEWLILFEILRCKVWAERMGGGDFWIMAISAFFDEGRSQFLQRSESIILNSTHEWKFNFLWTFKSQASAGESAIGCKDNTVGNQLILIAICCNLYHIPQTYHHLVDHHFIFINKIHQSFALHPLSQPNPIQIELIPLSTRFGTKFTSEVDLTNKRLGIGVINGFIGWSTIIKEYWQKSIYWLLPVFFDNDNDYYNTKQIPQKWQKKILAQSSTFHRRLWFLIWDRPCSLHYLPQVP